MFYVYVLKSQKDQCLYTGATSDLDNRLEKHNKGLIESTKDRIPFELIYFEACIDKRDAFRRERYLKTTYGKHYETFAQLCYKNVAAPTQKIT